MSAWARAGRAVTVAAVADSESADSDSECKPEPDSEAQSDSEATSASASVTMALHFQPPRPDSEWHCKLKFNLKLRRPILAPTIPCMWYTGRFLMKEFKVLVLLTFYPDFEVCVQVVLVRA